MLSLLKKNPEQTSGSESLPWHPNFRDASTLPDTKVVRTTFFINAITGLLAAGLLIYLGYQEYVTADLRAQIKALDGQIARDAKPSQEAVALYATFQAEEKKLADLENFLKGHGIVFSNFLYRLGQTVPPKISVTTIEYTKENVTLRGLVVGTPEQASGMVAAYEKQLRAEEVIGKVFDNIALTTLSRDAENGRLAFEINLRSTPAKPEPRKR